MWGRSINELCISFPLQTCRLADTIFDLSSVDSGVHLYEASFGGLPEADHLRGISWLRLVLECSHSVGLERADLADYLGYHSGGDRPIGRSSFRSLSPIGAGEACFSQALSLLFRYISTAGTMHQMQVRKCFPKETVEEVSACRYRAGVSRRRFMGFNKTLP